MNFVPPGSATRQVSADRHVTDCYVARYIMVLKPNQKLFRSCLAESVYDNGFGSGITPCIKIAVYILSNAM